MAATQPKPNILVATVLLALAATLNLATLGVFEADEDLRQGHRSLALRWGRERTRSGILALSASAAVAASFVAGLGGVDRAGPFAILAVQAGMPAMVLLGGSWFERNERYRSWGDAVFLLGALPWLLRVF